jgi:hypothetical protein
MKLFVTLCRKSVMLVELAFSMKAQNKVGFSTRVEERYWLQRAVSPAS